MNDKMRWEKAAYRENMRRVARDPLFAHAGLVPRTTAEEQQARVAKIVADQTARIDDGEAHPDQFSPMLAA